jgi:hypothetical protein
MSPLTVTVLPTVGKVHPDPSSCEGNAPHQARAGRRAGCEMPLPARRPRPTAACDSSAATAFARASLERVDNLHFNAPALMGREDRGKVVDPKRNPIDDQDHTTFTVGRDPPAEPVVQHPIRTR